MSLEKPREIAFDVLLQHEKGDEFVEKLLEWKLQTSTLTPPDKALLHHLVYGIVRWKRTIDFLIGRKTAGRAQKAGLRLILSLGLYQLFWLDRVPDHAAVDESVELAKRAGFGPQAGFVNAVLRSFARETNETETLLKNLERDNPALGLSHPDWLFHRWEKRFGREEAIALLRWNNTPPPAFARVNTLKTDADRLKSIWDKERVEYIAQSWDWAPPGVIFQFSSPSPMQQLPSFREGLFYVQDPSTLLAVRELEAKPGEKILDFCAAPGGKTTFIAQEMEDRGLVVACDFEPERLQLMVENCRRLGVRIVSPSLSGSTLLEIESPYHRILIDAPCSNTGVMRRRLDLRWRLQPGEIERLARAQTQLLDQAAQLLAKGGRMVYSTCSIEPEENEPVIAQFLSTHNDFTLTKERSLLPFRDSVDGAFIAVLARNQF